MNPMSTAKKTILRTLIVASVLACSLRGLAQSPAPAPTPSTPPATQPSSPSQSVGQRGSDKVDLKKLEDKYWSAKDDDYGVIQNRTFSKSGKFFLSGVYGPLINDPFAKSRASGLIAGYYFSEDFGLEAHFLSYGSEKNENVARINSIANAGISPNYNLIASSASFSATYTPFYAKMAFMNMSIMYFDMGFTAGFGTTSYNQIAMIKDSVTGLKLYEEKRKKSAPHVEIGVMQQLFINKNIAFRLDIKNTFGSQKIVQYEISNTALESARLEETKSTNDTTITFGLTLFTN